MADTVSNNESNLVDLRTRTTEEVREIARKGGIASGEARREKKLFKEGIAERLGYEDFNAIIDTLIMKARDNGGKDFEILRDTLGQKPKDEIEVKAKVNDPFDELSVEELKKLANDK